MCTGNDKAEQNRKTPESTCIGKPTMTTSGLEKTCCTGDVSDKTCDTTGARQ